MIADVLFDAAVKCSGEIPSGMFRTESPLSVTGWVTGATAYDQLTPEPSKGSSFFSRAALRPTARTCWYHLR